MNLTLSETPNVAAHFMCVTSFICMCSGSSCVLTIAESRAKITCWPVKYIKAPAGVLLLVFIECLFIVICGAGYICIMSLFCLNTVLSVLLVLQSSLRKRALVATFQWCYWCSVVLFFCISLSWPRVLVCDCVVSWFLAF